MRGKRFAYNSLDSMSGIIALSRDLEAMGESLDIFSERIETGAHRASIVAVAEGRADVCADRLPHLAHGASATSRRPRGAGRRLDGRRKGLADDHLACTRRKTVGEQLIEILSPP